MTKKIAYFLSGVILVGVIYVIWPASTDEVYREVFSRLISEDDTYGGQLRPKLVYVSKSIVNYPDAFYAEYKDLGVQLDDGAINAISQEAKSRGVELRWIDKESDLKYNELGEVVGGGVVAVFGELNRFHIYSEIEAVIKVASLASGGTRYEFYKLFYKWKLFNFGMSWVS
ncbi:hypothetical protein [Vibrio fluvialis]|uniref:hypothetical protein n=2 Tax=Vibrio fluvialis TaxID=676 RepID=UPI001EEB2698|nr:hypothetical protein [Vibrio fluvialis]MCG6350351.1 hypothetical protein [Vibrio fluvialis]